MPSDRTFNFNEGCHVTFNDIHDNENCTIYTSAKPKEPTTEVVHPCLDTYITIGFRDRRKSEYENALSVIMDAKWSDKDRARFALVLYNSGNMIPKNKPATFNEWYQIFCSIFNFPYHKDYNPSKLYDNTATRTLKMYM